MSTYRFNLPLFQRAMWIAATLVIVAAVGCFKVDPTLEVSTREINFGTDVDRLTIRVRNASHDKTLASGVTALEYEIRVDQPWITVLPSLGRCGEGVTNDHTVIIDRSLLVLGDNLGNIIILSNGGEATVTVRAQRPVPECEDPPTVPWNPAPLDGAVNVPLSTTLVWSDGNSRCPGLTASYDVYFGTTSPPPFDHDNGTTKSWTPDPLNNETTYYWRVVAVDSNAATSSAEWSFTTTAAPCVDPPAAVNLIGPANGATDVSIQADVSWSGGTSQCPGLTATYDVYFGTTSPAPFSHDNGTNQTWDPGVLANETTYYWRVVATDPNGSTSSVEHSFTTEVAPCVTPPGTVTLAAPANGATDVSIQADIVWSGGLSTCAGLTATYDVYFGTTSPPPFSHNNGTTQSWDPGPLNNETTYYWRIVATDANGSTSSAQRSFTTEAAPCLTPPSAVALSAPADGATDVSVDADLSWTGGLSTCVGLTATYDVYFGTTSPPPFDHNNGTTQSWDPGTLDYETTYYWRVVATDPNGSTSSVESSFTTEVAPCLTPPGAVTLTLPADGAANVAIDADLSWTGGLSTCTGLTATYDVYFGTTSPPPFDHNNGTTQSWDPGPLTNETTYYWRVVAIDPNGSTSSVEQSFTTEAAPCLAGPGAVNPVSPANGATDVSIQADLSWTGGLSQCPGLTATYDVYFGTTFPPPFHHNNGSAQSWDPGPLNNETTYYWRIIAVDANGSSASGQRNFTTEAAPCLTPPGVVTLSAPADGATDVSVDADLSWTGGLSTCVGLTATYDVYFGTTSPPPFDHNNGTSQSWDPGILDYETTYYWSVVATDPNGSTSSVERSFTTEVAPCLTSPGAVTLSAPADGATNVAIDADLSWTGGLSTCTGLTATYDVYFGTTSPPPFDHNNGTTQSWDPGTLANETTYYWRVVAIDPNGSTSSVEQSFTTEAAPCLTPPGAVTLTSPSDGATDVSIQADLSWEGGLSTCAGLTATYDVYFGTTSPPPFDHDNGASQSWDPGALANATTYYWRIVATDANGNTSSIEQSFTTEAAPCLTPPTAVTLASPPDSAAGVSVDADLSWTGGLSTCAGLTATYDVYFGTTSPPPFDHNNGTTQSWDPGTLANETVYYWRVVATDPNGSTSSVEQSFTTEAAPCLTPPSPVTLTSPTDGATDVSIQADLSWEGGLSTCVGLTATYDVYFGTTSPPPFDHDNGASQSWDPGTLANATTYYWHIVATDANGSTSSIEQSFTTEAAPCLTPPTAVTLASPPDSAAGVSVDADLSWTGGLSTCDSLTATYDVYFGTTSPPPFDHNNGTTQSWDPGTLANETVYYWRVVATDPNGSTSSVEQSFTTEAAPCVTPPSAVTLSSPADGATNVSVDAVLSWTGGLSTCAGLTATYDLYLGTTSPPPFDRNNGTTPAWDPDTLAYSTTYYWRVVATDANGSTSSIEQSFTTEPAPCADLPTAATLVAPGDADSTISVDQDLVWSGGVSQCPGLTATYDVYFGTTTPPPFDHNDTLQTWDPGTLSYGTAYYWQINTVDANGVTEGPIWSFTTELCLDPPTVPCTPNPTDGATNINTNRKLQWACGDSQCPDLIATYDIYIGTTPILGAADLVVSDFPDKSYTYPLLQLGTTYYWQIVAKDANGEQPGPVWQFTTRQ